MSSSESKKPRGVMADPKAMGSLGGKRSGEARRAKAEAQRIEKAVAAVLAAPPSVERDGGEDRRRLEAIRDNPGSRDADVIAAVRALRDLDRSGTVDRTPPSVERLYALSTAELEALVMAHCGEAQAGNHIRLTASQGDPEPAAQ